MAKKETKTEKTETVEKLNKKELRAQAKELKIDSDRVLDYLEDDNLEGLAALIDTEKERIAEQQAVVELVKSSSLNKQSKNCLGLWYSNSLRGWNLFTSASTKWLIPMAELVMTHEFKEFMASEKRLSDVKKFVEYLEKK